MSLSRTEYEIRSSREADAITDRSYTIEELASESRVKTSTIRYYQSIGILEPPARTGRVGIYLTGHLERLQRIRRLRKRGFSLAAIRQLLIEHDEGGSISRLLGTHETSEYESDLSSAVQRAFPDQGSSAPPIQNAVELGVLKLDGDQVSVVQESMEPMVRALLHLFELGMDEEAAMQTWQLVIAHTKDIATHFSDLAHTHIYPTVPLSEHAEAASALVSVAKQVVEFALDVALDQEIGSRPDSVIS